MIESAFIILPGGCLPASPEVAKVLTNEDISYK